MNSTPKVVCICGSLRFRDDLAQASQMLTLAGYIVVAPVVMDDVITERQRSELGALHLAKIDLSDLVYVVDPGGYTGESTAREIQHAQGRGIPVVRLSEGGVLPPHG